MVCGGARTGPTCSGAHCIDLVYPFSAGTLAMRYVAGKVKEHIPGNTLINEN